MFAGRPQSINLTFKVTELFERAKKNREVHASEYTQAKEGYLLEAQKRLEKKLEAIKSGKLVPLNFDLRVPTEHLEEYDTLIDMLSSCTDTEIKLDVAQFQNIVKDKWDWSESFKSLVKYYTSS